jgi:DNA-binding transcriptional ArsR family regulator
MAQSADEDWGAAPVQVTDAAMLRAFAHPLRQRIVRELAVRKHARAADLAGWLDEPANALSFHLRTLAKPGVIHEVPEKARDKRDRVWALVSRGGFSFERPGDDPAVAAYVTRGVEWIRRLAMGELDDERAVTSMHFGGALLTKDEAEQMAAELDEVLTKWRKLGAENAEKDPDDPRRVSHDVAFGIGPSPRR